MRPPPRPTRPSPARRRLLEFLGAVMLLHTAAIAGYYLLDVRHFADRAQRWYAWVWMGLTVAVVVVGLQRIKRARRAGSASGQS